MAAGGAADREDLGGRAVQVVQVVREARAALVQDPEDRAAKQGPTVQGKADQDVVARAKVQEVQEDRVLAGGAESTESNSTRC